MMKHKRVLMIISVFIFLVALFGYLFLKGIVKFNTPSRSKYPVRGVDVASYQGDINWDILAKQDIQFAFIKATEGSNFVDDKFLVNYKQAIKTKLYIGAYHFFSYDSSGAVQATNFIAHVPKSQNMLPPVVDIEFYGDKEKNLPDKKVVTRELQLLLKILENHYGVRPLIYATNKAYRLYISGSYANYDIWIRDVYFKPRLSDGHKWTFWQYTNKGRLQGYKGTEKYIDINVFNGSKQDFDYYINSRTN